jgi:hypothetical protein
VFVDGMVGVLGEPPVAFVPHQTTLCPVGGSGKLAGKLIVPFWHAVAAGSVGAIGLGLTVTGTEVMGLSPHPMVLTSLTP